MCVCVCVCLYVSVCVSVCIEKVLNFLSLPSSCRRKNERPWQKRWVVFNGSELKYFKNKSDKDNLCLNTVELEKMIDVKRMVDVSRVTTST